MIPITYTRLLSRGDLPGSDGGLYNPGAFRVGDETGFVVRREEDYTWTRPAHVFLCAVDGPAGVVNPLRTLTTVGHDSDARLEDVRPFVFQGEVLLAHTRWKPHDRAYPIKPVLSRLDDSMFALIRHDDWDLPLIPTPIEKNWVLLAKDADLYTVYSLDPLTIFRRAPLNSWRRHAVTSTDWTARLGKPPRLSCHLLPFRGGYLGWWHTILDQWYVHGAYWLDDKLRLRARTGVLLDGQWVRGDVFKPGCLYVSSQLLSADEATLYLFYGEGDAHSGVATLAMSDVLDALRFNTNGASL